MQITKDVEVDLRGKSVDVIERMAAPDVIVVADTAGHPAQDRIDQARKDPALSQLRAVRENRFVVIPFSETTSGVRLLDGARRVAEGIRALP